ncbi:flavodoxin family protein [Sporomusa aerivorans]|uniref:flavodoxin family protein n=1 Tax=Sporomusa aerivorans TaxID=204936 RepID=UPI00352B7DD8
MKILGISGSPVPNSNTDRLVLQVLRSSSLDFEFIKLSNVHVRPCLACKSCVEDNTCKVSDDFPEIAQKMREVQAVVIGGYTPYRMLDAYTKAFLERLWSMRHNHSLNEKKYVISIISGLYKEVRDAALNAIAIELQMERMHHVAEFGIQGNVPCLTCGYGDDCKNSGIPHIFTNKIKASPNHCVDVEEQQVWEEASKTGQLLGQFLKGETNFIPCIKPD